MTTDLVPAGITEKWLFLLLADKRSFWQKVLFFQQKKHLKSAKRLMISIWEKGTFLFAQLCPVVVRTWCPLRSEVFWAPKVGFRPKNPFFAMGPQILSMACF